ncbi:hypothetical protein AB832_06980 [Flavobacteriaceae bacterium (ex Bugula neritina AB1)]|nr:hypothetical protein AB832_06980 [Flavobacteriaceae bacterium (ex Bugula neritina AB1)]
MADNNFKEGNSLQDNYLPANPYAEGGFMHNLFPQIQYCKYYASFEYAVDATGATATIMPLTGNLSGDLRYYRVEVYDGNKCVSNTLDLANRSTPFVINTSTLNANNPWTFSFYGEDGRKTADVGCSLRYAFTIDTPKNATGNSVPPVEKWDNVKFILKLDGTTDGDYTLFPTEGVQLSRDGVIDLHDYTTTQQLKNGETYDFKLYAYKVGLSPLIALPVADPSIVNSIANNVTFPYALGAEPVDIADVEINSSTNGSFSGLLTSGLINEGVTPSISITINTVVA